MKQQDARIMGTRPGRRAGSVVDPQLRARRLSNGGWQAFNRWFQESTIRVTLKCTNGGRNKREKTSRSRGS